jgi:hypothetical protein
MPVSKFTAAIKMVAPDLASWVNYTFTGVEMVYVYGHAGKSSFRPPAPIDDEVHAAKVFRSYRADAVWSIQSKYESLDHFRLMRCGDPRRDHFQREALVCAIALMLDESPHLFPAFQAARAGSA